VKPFLALRRQEIVELETPWDPKALIADYVEAREPESAVFLSPDDLIALQQGAIVRFDLLHPRFGSVEAELHVDVLRPTEVAIELAAQIALRWWVRLLALPFRGRARRWINRRVDQMIDELRAPPAADEDEAPMLEDATPSSAPTRGATRWTLRVMTLEGRSVYQRTEGPD
jgi:hypothetical protein